MTDLETDATVDPVLARVAPRWSGARTERNLAATFDRIAGVRRARRVGVLAVLAVGATAAVFVVRARPEGGAGAGARVAAAPSASRPAPGVAPVTPRSADVGAGVAARPVAVEAARADANVKVARVDVKIASQRSLFRAQVARREYAAAYRSLVATPAVADHSAEDLMLAADAARLSGHPAESVPYFRKLLTQHESDARAPVAAFTLGRILLAQLARPAEAADAFALARRLAPDGALAADALAREVEAAAGAGDGARARARAQEYVSRYPTGRRAAAVKSAGGLE